MQVRFLALAIMMFFTHWTTAQNTVGLISKQENATDGYTFIYTLNQANGYLINACGEVVNSWTDDASFMAGASAYITPEGNLLKTKRKINFAQDKIFAPGAGGIVELKSWNNDLLWSYELNNDKQRLHHDIKLMPNGNILMLVWEEKSREECIQAGRNPAFISDGKMYNEKIIEINPSNSTVVWEWSAWDHLIQDFDSSKDNYGIVADHPEKIDINLNTEGSFGLPNADWMHINSIDYNPFLDQILISAPIFSEIMIIDHSTTTEQAKGSTGGLAKRGGDLLYRWGNPANYDRGTADDRQLFFQHDAKWLVYDISQNHPDFGKISVFNNRVTQTTSWGAVLISPWDMYQWSYTKTGNIYGPGTFDKKLIHPNPTKQNSPITSGVQLLPNGNYYMTSGNKGYCYELTPDGKVLWEYVLPYRGFATVPQGAVLLANDNPFFSSRRFSPQFKGFEGKDLSAKSWIELNPDTSFCSRLTASTDVPFENINVYPNPASETICLPINSGAELISIYDVHGKLVLQEVRETAASCISVVNLKNGVYLLTLGDYRGRFIVNRN